MPPSERERGSRTEAVERLFKVAVLLTDGMEAGLAERGLTRARAELLWRLGRHGPMTQRNLSQVLACTPRNVTGLVDGLEEAGLVARQPHPTDRRATLVTLTPAGAGATRELERGYDGLGRALFGDQDAEQVDRFVGELKRILDRLQRETGASER